MKRAAALWGPVALWAGLLLFGSTRPASEIPAGVPDWLNHGLSYLVLGLLASRALAGGMSRGLGEPQSAAVVVLALLLGAVDEMLQGGSPGRDPSLADIGKDAVGAVLATVVWRRRTRDAGPGGEA